MSHAGFNYPNAVLDYRLEMARGKVPNSSVFGKFGKVTGVSAGTTVDIWCGPTDVRVDLVSAEVMLIASTDAADNGTATAGAHTVILFGVDNDWNETVETITLNGTTPVPTVNAYLRVNFMLTSATGGAGNAGVITATAQITSSVQDIIAIHEGYSCSTHYAVPKGKRVVLTDIHASAKKGDEGELEFRVNSVTGSDSYIDAFRVYIDQGTITLDNLLFSFGEGTDIKFQVEAITQNIGADCFYTLMQFPAD